MTTRHTTTFDRGSVVLVSFTFTDQSQYKRRPALVISTPAYHAARNEVVLAAITSNVQRALLPGDATLADWQAAGLLKPSVVTGIVRTVQQNSIERVLGRASVADLSMVDDALAPMLGFRSA